MSYSSSKLERKASGLTRLYGRERVTPTYQNCQIALFFGLVRKSFIIMQIFLRSRIRVRVNGCIVEVYLPNIKRLT